MGRKAKENPKLFNSFIRSKLRVKDQVAKLLREMVALQIQTLRFVKSLVMHFRQHIQ